MTAPFDDLRVVDLSTRFSGAFAARLFGDFGADVVLAELPEGHPLRHEPPFLDEIEGADRSVAHAFANWNKRSVVCAEDSHFAALIGGADVVVTTTTAPASGHADALPADAVRLSVTAHGLDDPLTNVPGNNLTMSARTGWASINGFAGEAPLAMPRDQSGIVGGVTGFIAAAAALRRRHATPRAEVVDVSELEAFVLTVHPWGVAAVYQGQAGSRGPGGGRRRGAPGPLWELADGRMNFGLADFHNWTDAMNILGLPELATRPELIPDIGRHSQNLHEVATGLTRSLKRLKRWDVFHALTQLRCVTGVVQDIEELTKNEQLIARNFFATTEIAGRAVRVAGAPAKLSPSPWRIRKPAPALGKLENPRKALPSREAAHVQDASAKALAAGPLVGIRVLSFAQAWSGTFGTELLALLGADVVQIASSKRPDAFRRIRNIVPAGIVDPDRTQHPANTQMHYNSVNGRR